MAGGRVKTLHPRIHGGLLANRADPEHMKTLKDMDIDEIDLVVCNLYAFGKVGPSQPHALRPGSLSHTRCPAAACHVMVIASAAHSFPPAKRRGRCCLLFSVLTVPARPPPVPCVLD